MADKSTSYEYLVNLYNGYNAVAERAEKDQLIALHIKTDLDEQIQSWISNGENVIITGNPGDGKTHLIEVMRMNHLLDPAFAETDASQRGSEEVLGMWGRCSEQGVPFVLAINHAPLRRLSSFAKTSNQLSYLQTVPNEIENLVYYNEAEQRLLPRTVVVDLSQRELLTDRIIGPLIVALTSMTIGSCPDCPPRQCPVEYNAVALSHPKIKDNLVKLLTLVARRGFHATMRDVTGFLAFLLTGGINCSRRWKPVRDATGEVKVPTLDQYLFYNLLFAGRSSLFDAVRATFDPAYYADPKSDMELWEGTISGGWLIPGVPFTQPTTLADLRGVKRKYFFEHDHDTSALLQSMLSTTELQFDSMIEAQRDDVSIVEELVEMINTLYAPQPRGPESDYRSRLRLWNSHRYSSGSVPGYVAMRSLSADKLTIYRPKAAPHLVDAIAVRKDHVLLGVQGYRSGDPALRVDWPMYHALSAGASGTPITVQPFHILRRLDLFLRSLGQDTGRTREIETIEWSDHGRAKSFAVRVNRTQRRYE